MSLDWYGDVFEFTRKFAPDRIGTTPPAAGLVGVCSPENEQLVNRLVIEEWDELCLADGPRNLPDTVDATIDLIYVLLGRLITFGVDARPVWDAVHEANMKKFGGGRREDQKILKPAGWVAPDVAAILAEQAPLS